MNLFNLLGRLISGAPLTVKKTRKKVSVLPSSDLYISLRPTLKKLDSSMFGAEVFLPGPDACHTREQLQARVDETDAFFNLKTP